MRLSSYSITRSFFYILTLLCLTASYLDAKNSTVLERLSQSHPGDYIVYEEGKSVHLLFIHDLDQNHVIFEEVIAPSQIKGKKKVFDWKEWILNYAPNHTSWLIFEIDLDQILLTECYSFTRNCWISLNSSESFMKHLIESDLIPISRDKRKKVGRSFSSEGPNTAKLWHPPITIEGKKVLGAQSEAFSIRWPTDDTPLSGKDVELYFYQKLPHFPFPHWLQITDASQASFKFRSIDSGSGLVSPYPHLPRRYPQFVQQPTIEKDRLTMTINLPLYYKNVEIFAVDHTGDHLSSKLLPAEKKTLDGELVQFSLEKEAASKHLLIGHRYTFAMLSEAPLPVTIESNTSFTWKE